jgi:hypothetical protein
MKAKFLLNGEKVGYLTHGQVFEMGYEIKGALFVFVFFLKRKENPGRYSIFKNIPMLHLMKSIGTYTGLSNIFSPNITFLAFGFGVKRFKLNLKINYLEVETPKAVLTYRKPSFTIDLNHKIRPNLEMLKPRALNTKYKKLDIKTKALKINQIEIQNQYILTQNEYNRLPN